MHLGLGGIGKEIRRERAANPQGECDQGRCGEIAEDLTGPGRDDQPVVGGALLVQSSVVVVVVVVGAVLAYSFIICIASLI